MEKNLQVTLETTEGKKEHWGRKKDKEKSMSKQQMIPHRERK